MIKRRGIRRVTPGQHRRTWRNIEGSKGKKKDHQSRTQWRLRRIRRRSSWWQRKRQEWRQQTKHGTSTNSHRRPKPTEYTSNDDDINAWRGPSRIIGFGNRIRKVRRPKVLGEHPNTTTWSFGKTNELQKVHFLGLRPTWRANGDRRPCRTSEH